MAWLAMILYKRIQHSKLASNRRRPATSRGTLWSRPWSLQSCAFSWGPTAMSMGENCQLWDDITFITWLILLYPWSGYRLSGNHSNCLLLLCVKHDPSCWNLAFHDSLPLLCCRRGLPCLWNLHFQVYFHNDTSFQTSGISSTTATWVTHQQTSGRHWSLCWQSVPWWSGTQPGCLPVVRGAIQ